jgi:hypothetical protein
MMTAIVFNGTKIYMDTDMELHIIRGDLHIDTKSFKPVPKARSVSKRTMNGDGGNRIANGSIIGTLRDSKLKIGKSVDVFGKRGSIAWAVKRLDMKAKITGVANEFKEGVFTVTRTA